MDYYDILGIKKTATQEEIKKAYRQKVKEYHPDLHLSLKEKNNAEEIMKKINEAYTILSDVEKRKKYNQSLIPKQAKKSNFNSNKGYNIKYQNMPFFFDDDLLWELFFKNNVSNPRPKDRLFILRIIKQHFSRVLKFINILIEYHNIDVIDYDISEGRKYYTLTILIKFSNRVDLFKKDIKDKKIDIVEKKKY